MKQSAFLILLMSCSGLIAQVPNSGFEQWTFEPIPVDWKVNSNPLTLPPWDPYVVRQDSDAYSGRYCANLYANGIFKALTWTTFPVSAYPLKMRFYGKVYFPPCINDHGWPQDTVSAKIQLLYHGAVVDSGIWTYTGANIPNYQLIEVPLLGNSVTFDSCKIYFQGGKVFGGCGIIADATQFRVDEVTLVNSSGCEASFYYSKQVDTVHFSGYSDHVAVSSWHWEFGDGDTSALQNPVHIFLQDRWYYPCLTVMGQDSMGSSCTAVYCDSVLITHGCIDTSNVCPPSSLCCDAPIYMPVCGCDSVTYMNGCIATLWYGVTSYTDGPCLTTNANAFLPMDSWFQIYPNPFHDQFMLSLTTESSQQLNISVKNILGETVYHSDLGVIEHGIFNAIINPNLPDGIYLLEARVGEKRIWLKKIVKQ